MWRRYCVCGAIRIKTVARLDSYIPVWTVYAKAVDATVRLP